MTLETFKTHNFGYNGRETIDRANAIIADYTAQNYQLTLRQLYYRFVATVPDFENSLASYKRFGQVISKARLAGQISWRAIDDNHREFNGVYVEEKLEGALEGIDHFYAPDLWQDQDVHVEVWVEKDALNNVIARPCRTFKVPFMACKGYMSSSMMWKAAHRFRDAREQGKECVLIHLGDHDPSGMDMSRDNAARLQLMLADVEIERIALNMDQVRHYNPPPNPAKITDSRAKSYIAEFGKKSWELDALEPKVINKLLTESIRNRIVDPVAFSERKEDMERGREIMRWIGDNSADVVDWAQSQMDDE